MKKLKVYVAGKVSNDSVFGTHDWRDKFLEVLSKLSNIEFTNFDPTRKKDIYKNLEMVFGGDVFMVSQVDVVVVYLTDDLSIGASQEILIAKYFNKPVIGLAPRGGRFNGGTKKIGNQTFENYKHPFVFSTCDVVCGDVEEVAEALKNLHKIKPKTIDLIKEVADKFEQTKLKSDKYLSQLVDDS